MENLDTPADSTERLKRQPNANSTIKKSRIWLGRGALVLSGALAVVIPSTLYVGYEFAGSHTTNAVAGVLLCPPGEPVVGAWIEPSDHADRGWVTWHAVPGHPNVASFTAGLPHSDSHSYDLGVGCGGTPQVWEHNDQSPEIVVSGDLAKVTCSDQAGVKNGACAVAVLALGDLPG